MCNSHSHDPLNGAADPYGLDGRWGSGKLAELPPPEQTLIADSGGSSHLSRSEISTGRLSRRNLLKYAGTGTAAILASPLVIHDAAAASATSSGAEVSEASVLRPIVAGQSAVPGSELITMAMHVHASFSEYTGSMEAQLSEAEANNVNVLWWTEHDWRMAATCYRTQVSFDSLADELQFGAPWVWQRTRSGAPTKVSGGIVSSPLSPNDPSAVGALKVKMRSADTAAFGYFANTDASRLNHHGNIDGMSMTIDLYPQVVTGAAYLEVLLILSRHTPINGRPAGIYQISYRFGKTGATTIAGQTPGSHVVTGLTGIVTQALASDAYTTATIIPSADFAQLWPEIDPRDNALSSMYLRAGSVGSGTAYGYFDNLTLAYPTLSDCQATQSALIELYGPAYPSVDQIAASEVSFYNPHINVFGADVPISYAGQDMLSPVDPDAAYFHEWTDSVRTAGGVSSLNHVYGTSDNEGLTPAEQASLETATIHRVLRASAYGCDLFEAGYRIRGGMPLESHLAAWDACSRNGIVTTGNGTNDDHYGAPGRWATEPNRFLTFAWAATSAEADIVSALAAGRVYVADLTSFNGSIDLQLDDGTPMGGVTGRGTMASRQLTIMASSMPIGSYFEVIRGPVDFAGSTDPAPGTTIIATVPASAIASGPTQVTVPTTADCFYRLSLYDPGRPAPDQRVAFSNPIWIVNATLVQVDSRRLTA